MWKFTQVADWFDGQRRESEQILDQWVESSQYSQGAMITAASTKALMTFGAGFADILRLGDGVKEGSLKGAGQDALRLIAVFPVGKAASLYHSAKGLSIAKVVADTGGPNCFWIASAKAFAQVGQKFNGKLLASVEDVAKALGMNMNALWRIPNLVTGMSYLRHLGAQVGVVKSISSFREAERMVPFDGSVVMLSVHVMNGARIIGGHAIYAFRTVYGQIRYMDRTVGNGLKGVVAHPDELCRLYAATSIVPVQAALIRNMFAKSVAHEAPRLVIPVLGVIASEPGR